MKNITPKRIEMLRRRMGLNQDAFAIKLGVSGTTVYYWESGKVKPTGLSLKALEKAFSEAEQPKEGAYPPESAPKETAL